jgi:hypothetical protein
VISISARTLFNSIYPVSLIINIASFGLITVGLLGEDIFIHTANYGPLIIISFGLLLQVVSIEYNHQLSQMLDSMLLRKINVAEKEMRTFSHLVSFSILLIAIVLFLILIWSISKSLITFFALLSLLISIFFGLFTGRIFSYNRGKIILKDNQEDIWNFEMRKAELEDLGYYLMKQNFRSNNHQKRLDEQSDRFTETMMGLCNENADFLDYLYKELGGRDKMESSNNYSRYFTMINWFIQKDNFTDSNIQERWFRDAIELFGDNRKLYSRLTSYVMLNPLNVLVQFLFDQSVQEQDNTEIHYRLASEILLLLGDVASKLDSESLFISGSINHRISYSSSGKQDRFIFELATKSSWHPKNKNHYRGEWSSWWLLHVKIRLQIMMESPQWDEINVQKFFEGSNDNISNKQYADEAQNVISCLLTQTGANYHIDQDLMKKHRNDAYKKLGYDLESQTIIKRKSFMAILNQSIGDLDGTSTDILIKQAWALLMLQDEIEKR